MSDFETRFADALSSGADQAPGADGLAAGARTRARRRRRTRYSVGVAVAVVAIAVPVGVLATGDEGKPDRNPVAVDPTDDAPSPQTVEHEGALVDIPGGWERLDTSSCEFKGDRFGPPGANPCAYEGDGLTFLGSATFDPAHGPGLREEAEGGWAGYVNVGESVAYVQVADREQGLRILGSARLKGQEAPDLSAGFRTETYNGLSIDVPADWREGTLRGWCVDETVPGWVERPETVEPDVDCPAPQNYYGIRFGGGRSGDWIRERIGPEYPDGSWAGVAITPRGNRNLHGIVQVVAPTQGLAELIGGSLRAD